MRSPHGPATRKHPVALAFAVASLLLLTLVAPAAAQGQPAPFCQPGERPRFTFGFAQLRERVGRGMGEPTECEHVDPASGNGDTLQATTTGLAFYRRSTNTPTFTDGSNHFALDPEGLLFWTADSIDPPEPTFAESAYLDARRPLLGRENDLLDELNALREPILDLDFRPTDVARLSAVRADLAAVRDEYGALPTPPSLAPYRDLIVAAQSSVLTSVDALIAGRQAGNAVARDIFFAQELDAVGEGNRLRREAGLALSRVVAIFID